MSRQRENWWTNIPRKLSKKDRKQRNEDPTGHGVHDDNHLASSSAAGTGYETWESSARRPVYHEDDGYAMAYAGAPPQQKADTTHLAPAYQNWKPWDSAPEANVSTSDPWNSAPVPLSGGASGEVYDGKEAVSGHVEYGDHVEKEVVTEDVGMAVVTGASGSGSDHGRGRDDSPVSPVAEACISNVGTDTDMPCLEYDEREHASPKMSNYGVPQDFLDLIRNEGEDEAGPSSDPSRGPPGSPKSQKLPFSRARESVKYAADFARAKIANRRSKHDKNKKDKDGR